MDPSIRELLNAGAHCTNAPLHFLLFIYRDTSIFIGFWGEKLYTHPLFQFQSTLNLHVCILLLILQKLDTQEYSYFLSRVSPVAWICTSQRNGVWLWDQVYVFDPLVNVEDWIGKRKERRNLLKNDPSDKKASILNLLINTLRSIPDCYIF